MVRVAGIWEFGWNCPLQESWLWTFVLREFGITAWSMTPVTGIIHNERHSGLSLSEYETPQKLFDANNDPEIIRVFIDEKGDEELAVFHHPTDAMYVFGCAGRDMLGFRREQDHIVKLTTPGDSGVLWPHQCLLAVLYDRHRKEL